MEPTLLVHSVDAWLQRAIVAALSLLVLDILLSVLYGTRSK